MNITISYATLDDLSYLEQDSKVKTEMMKKKILNKEFIIAKGNNTAIGWLRFGYFWDTIPFINHILIEKEYRRQGIATQLVRFWQEEMKKNGFTLVMTSTQADEDAQHFYRKLGYHDMGSLFELNDGPAEIVLSKRL